ncbi:hypothetical protein PV08_07145 [Exophiala spinifera]|uniref:Alpha/beta hydrolase fold-3 domain-containing protein n=1 Tax=Exophiala spinifera TaxID=91928 RepID=A0A0D2B638_9EURO|nr:uncharacterized protein PV08_07145 [Exophiala spinifera]KIW14363.1 hypothetical protein PV08_07145 [Exophiala spinifera]
MAGITQIPHHDGYTSRTFIYKTIDGLEIKTEVAWPETTKTSGPVPVLLHYHGNRFSFLPSWLIGSCVSRGWIFVTPDYRLIPETTAHSCLDDAVDAYNWVLTKLGPEIGLDIGKVIIAGSSAGGYLALGTSCLVSPKPQAVVTIYGMLDFSDNRYLNDSSLIFGMPPIDSSATLRKLEDLRQQERPKVISSSEVPVTVDPNAVPRFEYILALQGERLFPDYVTGVPGMRRAIVEKGIEAIPPEHRRLFPVAFGLPSDLPSFLVLHGRNDSAVPFTASEAAAHALKKAGVKVQTEFIEDAEHGFDDRLEGASNLDALPDGGDDSSASQVRALKNVVKFLEQHLG